MEKASNHIVERKASLHIMQVEVWMTSIFSSLTLSLLLAESSSAFNTLQPLILVETWTTDLHQASC